VVLVVPVVEAVADIFFAVVVVVVVEGEVFVIVALLDGILSVVVANII
jgi:hypothetical protein